MMYQSIQVRSLADPRELHTFTYSPAIRDKMQKYSTPAATSTETKSSSGTGAAKRSL